METEETFKVGDQALIERGSGDILARGTITKITRQHGGTIIFTYRHRGQNVELKFNMNGRARNRSGFWPPRLRPATPEYLERWKRQQMLEVIQNSRWDEMATSVLSRVCDAIKSSTKSSEE